MERVREINNNEPMKYMTYNVKIFIFIFLDNPCIPFPRYTRAKCRNQMKEMFLFLYLFLIITRAFALLIYVYQEVNR